MTTPQPEQPLPPSHIRLAPTTSQAEQPQRDGEDEAREMQAIAEGVTLADRVTCMGKSYRIADKVGLMPLLKFAKTAQSGVDSEDLEGLVAIYDMLHDCIDPGEWPRFVEEMTELKAEADELMPVVGQTLEILNARPTRPSSGSSDGRSGTGGSSTPTSSSPAQAAIQAAGAPAGRRVPDWAAETIPVNGLKAQQG